VQERIFEQVGGREPIKVDVRLIAATNRDLEKAVATGEFRQDLFFRLNVVPLVLPPLRERLSDVPLLAELFRRRFAEENNRRCRGFSRAALARLMAWHWPGNVRELENVVAQAVILSEGERIETHDLPAAVRDPGHGPTGPAGHSLGDAAARAEREVIAAALEAHAWTRNETAAALGVSRVTLYKKIKRYGIGKREPG
jgi:two-component system response regulator AtoC